MTYTVPTTLDFKSKLVKIALFYIVIGYDMTSDKIDQEKVFL